MTAEELTNQVLDMRNIPASTDIWLTFEVFENGELERPLHPKERVLEQALQWCKLAEPSSAYLLVKKISFAEGICLCLCCTTQAEMWDWITSILKAQHDDLRPVILRRHSSSDVTKQKFGTMPLVPIRGDDTNSTMVTANQTLVSFSEIAPLLTGANDAW
ncbi:hypothetical protein AB205_0070560 [Aquarana catesbeiana]|uniref:Ras-associating domain-containing protein n=1 Tax=Aquarana catesbeiana TaxID=8400 RepID=A0A2G9S8D7_AQUCT|nr:hypothetical protein AB205_0070560 [Aquarana catesbeiana]